MQNLPQPIIDSAYYDPLLNLAYDAMDKIPDVASRLASEVERATVMPHEEVPPQVVNIGSEVTYRDNTTGREETVILVFPKDADIAQRRISVLTPIGAALIGLKEGDTLNWTTRTGDERLLTVIKVTPPVSA
jgi:regulator of nucleoside diphosphate kinase